MWVLTRKCDEAVVVGGADGLRHSTLGRRLRGLPSLSGTAAVNGDGAQENSPRPAPSCAAP
jgi:hypothetical protein